MQQKNNCSKEVKFEQIYREYKEKVISLDYLRHHFPRISSYILEKEGVQFTPASTLYHVENKRQI